MLTLIMALMPMAVTYAHYTDVASQIAALPVSMTVDHANQNTQSEQQAADHCQPHSSHPDKLQSSGCGFHVCADCAVISTFQFISTHSPSFYSLSEKLEPLSLIAPPAIRPPISPF
ncbi:MAG: hypothetical protein M0R33_16195 [Methylomonas sp.]|jgi:hypothetical protein|nr:hypothetical protein [Methylomonas sp.]